MRSRVITKKTGYSHLSSDVINSLGFEAAPAAVGVVERLAVLTRRSCRAVGRLHLHQLQQKVGVSETRINCRTMRLSLFGSGSA